MTLKKGFDYVEQIETTGGRPITNYILTLDTAKEISMMTRSETGRQVRKYFIEIEKKYTKMYEELLTKNVQKLTLYQKQLVELGLEMNTSALTYKGKLYTVTEIAKEYGMSARKLNILLRDLDIQHKDNGVWHVNPMYRDFVEYSVFNYMENANTGTGLSPCMKWNEKGKQFIDTILKALDNVEQV